MIDPANRLPSDKSTRPDLSSRLRTISMVLRELFLIILLVLSIHVSLPQSERIWAAYETPGDLIRLVLGGAIAVWIAINLFKLPTESGAHRAWLYIGIVGVPFALIATIAIW